MFNYDLHPSEQICFILRRLCDIGLGTISGGGASVCDETGAVWMSPKGKAKTDLRPEMIAKYLPDGTQDGSNRGSTEAPVFLAMHKARPDLKAIIHSHAPNTLAFMLSRNCPQIEALAMATLKLPNVAYIPFELAGSQALTDRASKAFRKGADVLMLEGHGTFFGGKDIYDAFAKLEVLESVASALISAKTTGRTVSMLTSKQIEQYSLSKKKQSFETIAPRTISMREFKLREELVVIAKRAYKEKHILSSMGSVSIRISENAFFITPKFADYYNLEPEELIFVENGKPETGLMPPDLDLHLAIYNEHQDINSIMVAVSPHLMNYILTDLQFKSHADFEVFMIVHDTKKLKFTVDAKEIATAISFLTPGVFVQNLCFVAASFEKFDPIRCLGIVQCANVLGQLESNASSTCMPLQYLDKIVLEEIYQGFWK